MLKKLRTTEKQNKTTKTGWVLAGSLLRLRCTNSGAGELSTTQRSPLTCRWLRSTKLESHPHYSSDTCTHACLGPSGCHVWTISPWTRGVTSSGVRGSSGAWIWVGGANCSGTGEAVFEVIPIHFLGEEGRTGQQNWKLYYILIIELNYVVSDVNDV